MTNKSTVWVLVSQRDAVTVLRDGHLTATIVVDDERSGLAVVRFRGMHRAYATAAAARLVAMVFDYIGDIESGSGAVVGIDPDVGAVAVAATDIGVAEVTLSGDARLAILSAHFGHALI